MSCPDDKIIENIIQLFWKHNKEYRNKKEFLEEGKLPIMGDIINFIKNNWENEEG